MLYYFTCAERAGAVGENRTADYGADGGEMRTNRRDEIFRSKRYALGPLPLSSFLSSPGGGPLRRRPGPKSSVGGFHQGCRASSAPVAIAPIEASTSPAIGRKLRRDMGVPVDFATDGSVVPEGVWEGKFCTLPRFLQTRHMIILLARSSATS